MNVPQFNVTRTLPVLLKSKERLM